MSAFADNQFTTDGVNPEVSEKTRIEFARLVGLYRFIGWHVNVVGSHVTITSGGGAMSSEYEIGDKPDSIRAHLTDHYNRHGARHSSQILQ